MQHVAAWSGAVWVQGIIQGLSSRTLNQWCLDPGPGQTWNYVLQPVDGRWWTWKYLTGMWPCDVTGESEPLTGSSAAWAELWTQNYFIHTRVPVSLLRFTTQLHVTAFIKPCSAKKIDQKLQNQVQDPPVLVLCWWFIENMWKWVVTRPWLARRVYENCEVRMTITALLLIWALWVGFA